MSTVDNLDATIKVLRTGAWKLALEVEIHFYPRRTKVPLPQGIWTM